MKETRGTIVYPIVTEKAVRLKTDENKYTFRVAKQANKIEIKHAVEDLFRVRVLNVTTQCKKGKPKRLGKFQGRRSSWKKAICTLKEGDKIEIFEGV